MKLTRTIVLGIAFLMPSVATMARAEDKPAAAPAGETAPADGEKKAKKGKKSKAKDEAAKKEEAPAAGTPAPAPAEKK